MSENGIGLLPIIAEFASFGLDVTGLEQRHVAESHTQQDGDELIHQWERQTKGWPVSIMAYREGNTLLGYFTMTEYYLLVSIKNIPQPLTITHPNIPSGVQVILESIHLQPVQGMVKYNSDTLFTGSINFITV